MAVNPLLERRPLANTDAGRLPGLLTLEDAVALNGSVRPVQPRTSDLCANETEAINPSSSTG